MIKKLDNKNIDLAKTIRSVFQASYKIEAKLLKVTNFPPLLRPLESYVQSTTLFYGYFKKETLAAVIEIDHNEKHTGISSLVVDPLFFRQGIAKQLIAFVFNTFNSNLFIVETGLDNAPAIKLYESYNFKAVKQWDTSDGIRKIKFEKRI